MDLRSFQPRGVTLGRRRTRPDPVALPAATPARSSDAAALLTGSSMRVMEAGLAVIAIATAILLGVGR